MHPDGGVGFCAGVHIKSKTDGKEDAAGEDGFEALNEFVLFRSAESDPEKVGSEGLELPKDLGFLFESAIGCAFAMVGSDNVEMGIFFELLFE